MCGIAGILNAALDTSDKTRVRIMQQKLLHRGPDGEGEFFEDHYTCAQTRLSIIDIDTANQPLFDESGQLVLVYNGEIYNYLELRSHLKALGYRFRTKGDGESILYLYREYGDNFVNYLRGMFAIALWDRQKRRLILARDRFGEKPLYIYQKPGRLIFCSEMKALLSCPEIPLDIDPAAINGYFHTNFIEEPRTPLKAVRKLSPAHIMTIELDGWLVHERRYWSIADAEKLNGDPVEQIREKLHEAVEFSLRADVPVGIALSGGLDSSAIASIAQRRYQGQISAISLGYPASENEAAQSDERHFARQFAKNIGIDFHEVEMASDEIPALFSQIVTATDDPVSDISGFGYYAVLRKARELGIPVVLFGHGGDELFGGYKWLGDVYRQLEPRHKWLARGYPGKIAYLDTKLLRKLYARLPFRQFLPHMRKQLQLAEERFLADKAQMQSGTNSCEHVDFWEYTLDYQRAQERLPKLFSDDFLQQTFYSNKEDDLYSRTNMPQPWPSPGIMISDLISRSYLVSNGITQVDRIGMHFSVETRLPLLDHRFVETIMGLRKTVDRLEDQDKQLFRQVLETVLPHEVIDRPKRAFRPPAGEWFRRIAAAYGERLPDGYLVRNGILSKSGAEILAEAKPEANIAMPLHYKANILNMWGEQIEAISSEARTNNRNLTKQAV